MELNDFHQWRMANLKATLFVVVLGLIATIERRPIWFGFLTDKMLNIMLAILGGVAVYYLSRSYVRAIVAYKPTTALQAKRANEQIRLTANFSSAIATAFIAVVGLSQLLEKDGPNYYIITIVVMIAGLIHGGGRNMVGLIKEEAVTAIADARDT